MKQKREVEVELSTEACYYTILYYTIVYYTILGLKMYSGESVQNAMRKRECGGGCFRYMGSKGSRQKRPLT